MTEEPLAPNLIAEPSADVAPANRQALRMRFFWFMAGAGVNYLLISIPLKWLTAHTAWPTWGNVACSLAVSTSFFFAWNYFINFRTGVRKREALPRYMLAVACMWALSTLTLTLLKEHDFRFALTLGKHALDLDIIATQFFLSGLKFFLYHKWVFPLPKDPA